MATQIMSLKKAYGTDSKKEIEGVPVFLPKNDDGTTPTIWIQRTSRTNQRYAKALERATKPFAAELRTKTLDHARADKMFIQAFAEGAIVKWESVPKSDVTNIDTDEGFADFNIENVVKLLTNLPELFVDLQERANDISLFREGNSEADAKN